MKTKKYAKYYCYYFLINKSLADKLATQKNKDYFKYEQGCILGMIDLLFFFQISQQPTDGGLCIKINKINVTKKKFKKCPDGCDPTI